MSEKPVASIKTLARYEPDIVYIGTGKYVAECVRADDGDYYLAADVDAAIEALREEVERLRADRGSREQQTAHSAITHCGNCGCDWLDNGLNPVGCPYCKQSAEIERLSEALRELVEVFSESGMYDEEVFAKARAELARENNSRGTSP